MGFFKKHIFFYRGYTQALFFLMLIFYIWFSPPNFFEGTWGDTLIDAVGIASLIAGELLRVWAVSHGGKWMRSRRLKVPMLITTGPYAYIRHPIYAGNFLIGLGMVVVADALSFIPVFLILFVLQYHAVVSEEESFLSEQFGEEFNRYRARVPKYFPVGISIRSSFAFGRNLPLKEFGTVWGIIVGGFFLEWIESPLHRGWIVGLLDRIIGRLS
ncbi:MAG: methyltransferase family protein [Candidatus Binatia bacterium]